MIPRRVRNYAEPLSGIADDLIRHLESIQDESGNVQDVSPELIKWAFKGDEVMVPWQSECCECSHIQVIEIEIRDT